MTIFFLLASLIETAIFRFSSALYILEIVSIAQNMSSASGDEAEVAMAEPGKKKDLILSIAVYFDHNRRVIAEKSLVPENMRPA